MGKLELLLLGTPQVRHAGQVLTFPTRKVLALLIYLVVEEGLHSREQLTALLWPESDEGRARSSFRRALALLRQVLDEIAPPRHLIVQGDRMGCDVTSDFECDLQAFQAAVRAMKSAAFSPLLLEELQDATSLYRGDFLDSFSLPDAPDFDDWVHGQRAFWHRTKEGIFDTLAQVQEEVGAIGGALATAARWRQLSPFNEQIYFLLMRLHFVAGDRSAALQVYTDCKAMLAAEFHAVPAPETESLARRIRTQAPPKHHSLPTQFVQRDPSAPNVEGPLVGREQEYTTLMQRYRAACHTHGQVVVLIGEAGIGKTRLATEFLNWTAAQGADILQGRAFETGAAALSTAGGRAASPPGR